MSADITNMRILVLSDRNLEGYAGGIIQFMRLAGVGDIARAVEEATDYLYNKEGVVLIQDGAGSVISGGPIPASVIRSKINFAEIPDQPLARFVEFSLTPEEAAENQPVIPVQDIGKDDFGDLTRLPATHPLPKIIRAGLRCMILAAAGIDLPPGAE